MATKNQKYYETLLGGPRKQVHPSQSETGMKNSDGSDLSGQAWP